MIKLTSKEFHVPSAAMLEVCGLICEHDLHHTIMEVDEDADTITLELQYTKQGREVIHQIEDLIADNTDDEEDDEESE